MTILNKEQLKNEIYRLSRYQVANGNPILKLLYPTVETIELDSVISILDNVEKPIIPQFVADWIEESHSFGSSLNHDIFNLITDAYDTGADERKLIENYLYDSSDAIETIVDAYRYGYEVEEEQKYCVLFGNQPHDDNWTYALTNSGSIEIFEKDVLPEWDRTKLTEQEIKDYDERYWPFAVKVEVLE